ncbi:hypothetical protein GmRootV118_02800 [Variovorax sp. V118]|uniref:hypothetical protein n=1 Tax=Variovorax sp. V118 TaxID=3065954 RepID=UPI0034E88F40
MNKDKKLLALSYQRTLIYLGLEDISAVFMLPEIGGGQGVNEDGLWVTSVAIFLRINLNCGFIEIASGSELIENCDVPSLLESVYLKSSPESQPEIWMGIQFSATKKLNDLLRLNNLLRWEAMSEEVNHGFIGSVFDAYEEF